MKFKMQALNRVKSFKITSVFVLAMLAIAMAVPAHAQSTVGTIVQIQGAANIQRSGATIAAAQNMPIMLHDTIATQPNSSLTIGLVDNSSLQLGASSTITIDDSVMVNGVGAPSKVGLLGGDLHSVIVGAMKSSSTTFEVHTPNAVGAIRGTTWDTHYDTDDHNESKGCRQTTRVDVQDGTVQVCNAASPPECKDIHQGKRTWVRCGAFWEGGTGFGPYALGIGLAGGVGVGIAAATGAFNGGGGGGGGGGGKPVSGSK
jgi:FecR-like protein